VSPRQQSAQASVALDDACPAAQDVHFVAPGAASASVIEPSPHIVHDDDSALLYMPAPHVLHAAAASPFAARLVPAAQLLQKLFPPSSWYLPASHDMQSSA
jgi:hypothetical protein